jgi:hypothetical protein
MDDRETESAMSIKRLTDDERATYLLGLAVRRHLQELAPDLDQLSPEATRTLATIGDWASDRLTDEEFFYVDYTMGHAFNPDIRAWIAKEVEEQDRLKAMPPSEIDDDIPF